ncbi:MAG: carbamoyltransferase HypF [Candidatus Omnitrophica bacterium]|nr:carbamoyltransferase HypF [Candidatus Omnitrophota bacterium]
MEYREVEAQTLERLRIALRGAIQGVGFRPFIYRLAKEIGLKGWVCNSAQGVFIEVEGKRVDLESFLLRIDREKPPRARIQSLEPSFLDLKGYTEFVIRESVSGTKTALVMPDIATCEDCLIELLDPLNRRYLYPFTNCTNCGPRFSIIEALPYDRENTTMKKFKMCGQCLKEYEDPLDRRFHAQPNACPSCGPHLELWDTQGKILAKYHEALLRAVSEIRSGNIVALKGIGGFQLLVDATNEEAVARLRNRKHREEKPLALMYPDLESIKADCRVTMLEERLFLSPEAPIVLVEKETEPLRFKIAESVAPQNPYLGAMLPYSPLHHLLLWKLQIPVVATSGNLSEEPIVIHEQEALEKLGKIADVFLVHNRPIARHVDDSIVRIVLAREFVLRRARGFAPLPVLINNGHHSILGVGAHLKNTVAQSIGGQVFISQHIGDLETEETFKAFKRAVESFEKLYDREPDFLACDLHPDYQSTRFAEKSFTPSVHIQHHYAHVLSCMAENEIEGRALGIAWDGTGLGEDRTIWGGEFLLVDKHGFERAAHFRTFMLPGGDLAIREPRRTAVGVLYELFGSQVFEMDDLYPIRSFSDQEKQVLKEMFAKTINIPRTSSAGRLFDAVAALLGICQKNRFEGQAAMGLEFALGDFKTDEAYLVRILKCGVRSGQFLQLEQGTMFLVDWGTLVSAMLKDLRAQVPLPLVSAKFHNALIEAIVMVAARAGEKKVVLSGGCFQNRYLLEGAVKRLAASGFQPYWHQRVPTNDGGIALGQIVGANRMLEDEQNRI